jgi:thymidylate synthase
MEVMLQRLKLHGKEVDVGTWQGIPTLGRPDLITSEVLNMKFDASMPWRLEDLQRITAPNLPWADEHFEERVGRDPTNPGEAYKKWPWWRGQNDKTMKDGKFTHTYQERFWPKQAGTIWGGDLGTITGIRYEWGDLDDVVELLRREPLARQAYLPIFFPEDTGATHRGRTPCTLGYHFLLRGSRLHLWYDIRSCDAVRHFRDDIYLAVRLVYWVLEELTRGKDSGLWADVRPGHLYFCAHSFHVHMGDIHLL